MNTITGTVIATKRGMVSGAGNPTVEVAIQTAAGETRTLRTASDVALAYEIENRDYCETSHTFEIEGARLARVVRS